MTINAKRIILAAIVLFAIDAAAQSASGYFVDEYMYRYQMNPAIANSKNFVSMPALGNVNATQRGSLALTDVIYSVNGETTTFLSPDLSAAEVLGNLKDNNTVGVSMNIGVFSAGFKGFNGYNTVSVNAKVNAVAMAPKELFRLMKEGAENSEYDISKTSLHAHSYMEVALGHSHQVSSNVRVGVALKALVGAGNVDANLDAAHLTLNDDRWTAVTNATIQSNIKNMRYEKDLNERTGHEYVSGYDVDKFGVAGFGLGADLGVAVKAGNFDISAAVLDLGFIRWSNNYVASTGGDKTFTTDKYTFNVDGDADNSFDNEWDMIKDDLSALYELDDMGDTGSRTRALASTMNVGVQYTLPALRSLSFGFLGTAHFQQNYTWTEARFSANYAPCKVLAMGANVAAGNYGAAFGWIANLHLTGFNLYAGMDHTFFKVAKQGVPLTSCNSVQLGINVPF